jgi:MFS family permease
MGAADPATAVTATPPTAPATRARYGVLAFLCSLSFVLYIDRLCISMAAKDMEQELGFDHRAMGFIFGAFTVAYGLFEVPTGRWGDRYGSRGVLTRIVLWWSAFTVLTGCVPKFAFHSGYELAWPFTWPRFSGAVPLMFDSFLLLLLIRFLFGAGEAGALPNAARVVARWFPLANRGSAQGLINTCTLAGGVVTPVVVAQLMGWIGWRWVFAVFGLVGVVWATAFYRWFRDDPAQHPAANDAERRLIAAGTAGASGVDRHAPVPWRRVLGSANVWLLGGVITCSAFTSYLYYFWYPTYLQEGQGLDREWAGFYASTVLAGGAVGCALGGFLSDWVMRRVTNRSWGRSLIGFGGLGSGAGFLLLAIHCDSAVSAVACTSLASLSATAALPTWWGAVTEISGQHLGTLFGLMNSLGVPGAFASQLFMGFFADARKRQGFSGRDQWDPAFYVYAAALFIGACGWLFVDSTKSAVTPAETPGPSAQG